MSMYSMHCDESITLWDTPLELNEHVEIFKHYLYAEGLSTQVGEVTASSVCPSCSSCFPFPLTLPVLSPVLPSPRAPPHAHVTPLACPLPRPPPPSLSGGSPSFCPMGSLFPIFVLSPPPASSFVQASEPLSLPTLSTRPTPIFRHPVYAVCQIHCFENSGFNCE